MPRRPIAERFRRILARMIAVPPPRITLAALGAVAVGAAMLVSSGSGSAAMGGAGATPTAAPADASALAPLGLGFDVPSPTAREIAAIARFAEIAGQPTPTAIPPTPTPIPPPPAAPPAAPVERPAPPVAPPAPAPAAPAPRPAPAGLDTAPMNGYEQALFDDTNRRRADSGLPVLRLDPSLVGIARIRARDMAAHGYFAHTSPVTGDTAFSLMDRYGVPYAWAGENLAKNNYPDAQCVAVADDALWNSAPHRENILGPNYTRLGVALAVDASGMKYFALVFAG
jgi:uncharacterized protein YkwD